MIAPDVVEIYTELERLGVCIWIDGGWAVDALLGRETRPHADLDIAMEERHVNALQAFLKNRGYHEVSRTDSSAWNFVLSDADGRTIDVHAFVFSVEGNGVLGPAELGQMYPKGALDGAGGINGVTVRCVAPQFMVKFKTSHALREIDRADVTALCNHFGLESQFF
jgi:lincosamide nucleotidyltransferase A/C/D/E